MSEVASFVRSKRSDRVSQDAVIALQKSADILIGVADGIGGRPNGDIASKIAIEKTAERWLASGWLDANILDQIVEGIAVIDATKDNKGMATTLSVACVHDMSAVVLHVGDSTIFHLRAAGIRRLTVPQTEAQDLVDDGLISQTLARRHPRRNVLTSVLSASGTYRLHRVRVELQPNDRLLAVTDGVTELLTPTDLRDLSMSNVSTTDFVSQIEASVETRGPVDDFAASCLTL